MMLPNSYPVDRVLRKIANTIDLRNSKFSSDGILSHNNTSLCYLKVAARLQKDWGKNDDNWVMIFGSAFVKGDTPAHAVLTDSNGKILEDAYHGKIESTTDGVKYVLPQSKAGDEYDLVASLPVSEFKKRYFRND